MMDAINEQFFKKENITEEEFKYYFELIGKCKDICDSKYIVNGSGKCEILELHLKKVEPSLIKLNGTVYIDKENRIINGNIYIRSNKIVIDMKVERLLVTEDKYYSTLDIFKIKDNKLIRTSCYDYSEKETVTEITDLEIKEKLR